MTRHQIGVWRCPRWPIWCMLLASSAGCAQDRTPLPAYSQGGAVEEVATAGLPDPGDFNQWRGPERSGELPDISLPQPLPSRLEKRWQVEIGEGHSTPVVGGDHVFVFSRQDQEERIRCLRWEDGTEIWRRGYLAPYSPDLAARGHGKGPKSTPLLSEGRLYTFGISGVLTCLRAADGAVLWQRSFQDEFSEPSPEFGAAASPLVDGDLLFVHVGGRKGGALRAFDKRTGEVRWSWEEDGPAYASPIVATLAGVRQLVTLTQHYVVGLSLENGQLLWRQPLETPYEQNVVTPLEASGNLLYSGLERGITSLRLEDDAGRIDPRVVWHNPDYSLYLSSPVRDDGKLFAMSGQRKGQLLCLDLATGGLLWETAGRLGENAALLKVGGLVWALTTNAELLAFEPSAEEFAPVARYRVAESETWAHPVFREGGLLIKDRETVTRYDF